MPNVDTADMLRTGTTTTTKLNFSVPMLEQEELLTLEICSHQFCLVANVRSQHKGQPTDGLTIAREQSGSGHMPTRTSPDKITTTDSGEPYVQEPSE